MSKVLEQLYVDSKLLSKALIDAGEPSLCTHYDEVLRKYYIISIASYHEAQITNMILNFAGKLSGCSLIVSFIEKKAIERQYHAMFDWNSRNINKFLSLFGSEVKTGFSELCNKNRDIEDGMNSFMEIGNYRNVLAHKNFAENSSCTFSVDEIQEKYERSKVFLEALEEYINEIGMRSKC